MNRMEDIEYRRRLIARVEDLRTCAAMPMISFRQQIGPVAALKWSRFVNASEEEAWNHFSLKTIDRIAKVFETGTQLFQFPDS